jgi:hypothetical protein
MTMSVLQLMFRQPAPDEQKVGEALKLHTKDKLALRDYFLNGQSFIGTRIILTLNTIQQFS